MNKKIRLDLIIIIIATILSFIIISPYFKNEGIPVNGDLPTHFLRVWCIEETNIMPPNTWCPYINRGTPTSQYYHPPLDFLMYLFSNIFGIVASFKIFIILSFYSTAIAAYIFLHNLEKKTAAAIAYSILVLLPGGWHIGGIESTFIVGMYYYVFSISFVIISLSFLFKSFESGSKKHLFFSIVSTLFIIHPVALLTALVVFPLLMLVRIKKVIQNMNKVLMFIIFGVLLNSYYIISLISKLDFFPASATGGYIPWNYLYNYLIKDVHWAIWFAFSLGVILLLVKYKRDKLENHLLFISLIILSLNLIKGLPMTTGVRYFTFFIYPVVIIASIGLADLANIKLNFNVSKSRSISFRYLSYALLILIIFLNFKGSLQLSKAEYFSSMYPFSLHAEGYSSLKDIKGRIYAEDTFYNFGSYPESYSHIHSLIPYYSNKEILSFSTVYFPKNSLSETQEFGGGNFIGKKISNYTLEEFAKKMRDNGVNYILGHTNVFIDNLINKTEVSKTFKFGILFKSREENDIFELYNATLNSYEYGGINAMFDIKTNGSALLLMKVNYFPNWMAYVNGMKTKVEECGGMICLRVEKDSIIRFKYSYLISDIIAYCLSFVALIVLVLMTFIIRPISPNKKHGLGVK